MVAGKLRHGFKAEAERTSERIRSELGLTIHRQIDVFALAGHLAVPVITLRALVPLGFSVANLKELLKPEANFSAVTVWFQQSCIVVYNDAHHPRRLANDITHELSHVIAKHPPRPAMGYGGCREWDEVCEEEANYLAGAILVPGEAIYQLFKNGGSIDDGVERFGVSADLIRMRVNQTGVIKRLARRRAQYSAQAV